MTEMGQISGATRFYVCGPLALGVLASWGLVLSYVSLSAKHSDKISITGSKLTELLFTVPDMVLKYVDICYLYLRADLAKQETIFW